MAYRTASDTCLLLVDVQEDFWSGNADTIQQSFPHFPKNVKALLDTCRTKYIEIIHIRAVYNDAVSPWLPAWRLGNPEKKADAVDIPEPFAKEMDGEKVIHKPTFDGFLNTELEDYLKQSGKKQVIVAGLITSCCVLFTASGAYMRGYEVLIADECCGDRSQQVHENMLNRYATGYMFQRISLEGIGKL